MNLRAVALAATLLASTVLPAQKTWNFVVSGDSRNCGDIVMPAIAEGAKKNQAEFYWHLGDLRAIFAVDEDIAQRATGTPPASLADYQKMAWKDAIDNQLRPFTGIPIYLGLGNHETIPPKSRAEFTETFLRYLAAPALQQNRQ